MESVMRLIRRGIWFALAAVAVMPLLAANAWTESVRNPDANSARGEATVCDGVYSAAQARRGQQVFATHCAQCHGVNLRGGFGVASLVGPAFTNLWGDQTLWDLFDRMRATMPLESAGALSDQSYLDVLARILEVNDFPVREESELPLEREGLKRLTVPKRCPGES